ncbi:MAG TPA: histidine triad nucleotide-binding protein [Gemmatimonadales bacterium]|nr:histidine triad nucleotide-binding protein [Gemmatimonadales bacterium]
MSDCIFCRIASGEIPARLAGRSAGAVAFHDLNPQAPTHVLVIPSRHLGGANDAAGEGGAIWSEVMGLAVQVAKDLGLQDGGYRLVVNQGRDGGQSVNHLHVHVLGGRRMGWPPG